MTKLRNRQVHLDFHTSEFIPRIGEKFDAEQFATKLKQSHVNSITCFARCHHGWLYYPSVKYPELIHPNLKNQNLLLDQIDACHNQDIKVPIYTTIQWDAYIARKHPEWLAVDEDGQYINTQNVAEPHFYYSICLNSDYRQFFLDHLQDLIDIVTPKKVDGLFLDILFKTHCYCERCNQMMTEKGYDTTSKRDRALYAIELMNEFRDEVSRFIKERVAHATIFYNSSHVGYALKPTLHTYTHLELESLPSGGWGYDHFPTTVRYARNLGKEVIGMTGKFHTYWGDFHSLKNKAALEFECFNMLATGVGCSIGDQLHPSGKLSEAAYDLIGHVYSKVEALEPYCADTKPVVEIGIFTPEEFYVPGEYNLGIHPVLIGTVRMLQELSYQFDIIDSQMAFDKYKLIILPDVIEYSEAFQRKLEAYVSNGGTVIGSYKSLVNEELAVDIYGNKVLGASAYDRTFIMPNNVLGKKLPKEEHVMYLKGMNIESSVSEVLMHTVNPYFNREGETYCSHQHAPSSQEVGSAAATKNGNIIYFASPIFRIYRKNAASWCKWLVKDAIDLLLQDKLVTHNGPSTVLTALNKNEDKNNYILHVLHYITEKRAEDIYTIEDIIPLSNIKFQVFVSEKQVEEVLIVPSETSVLFEQKGQYIEFTLQTIEGYAVVQIK